MTTYLAEFHSAEDNMTALVFESKNKNGGFAVALRDDDSGNLIPESLWRGFKTIEAAITKAKEFI